MSTLRTERPHPRWGDDVVSYTESTVGERFWTACDFCLREDEDVLRKQLRVVEYSRSGTQSVVFRICKPCRRDLRKHLAENRKP